MLRLFPLLLALVPLTTLAQDEEAKKAPAPRIKLRLSPLVDLWFEVRARAEEEGELAADDPWAPAVAAARAAAEALGTPIAFGLIEGRLPECTTVPELQEAFSTLPQTFTLRLPGGERRPVKLRELALAIADEVAKLEEAWRADRWPAREKELTAVTAAFAKTLADGREAALLDRVTGLLSMKHEGLPLPVFVMQHAPSPGGFTHRTREGGVSFVAVGDLEPLRFAEVVLHEALHILDVHPANRESLLNELRGGLRKAGAGKAEGTARHVIHSLFFLAAGEAVRSVLDPDGEYVDYGIDQGVYARLGPAFDAVRPAWQLHLAGELGTPEFADRVVEAFTKGD